MKICVRGYDIYQNPSIPNTRISGLTIYTENLLTYWRKHAHSLELSFIRSSQEECLKNPKIVDGIAVYGICTKIENETPDKKNQLLVHRIADPRNPVYRYRSQQLAEIIHQVRPDVVNVHNTRPAGEIIWAHKHRFLQWKFRTFLTLHDLFEEPMRFIAENIEYFDSIIAVSSFVLKKAMHYGIPSKKLRLIYPGMDIARYEKMIQRARRSTEIHAVKKKIGLPECSSANAFIILIPARRVQHKGHRIAFEVLKRLYDAVASHKRKPYLLISGAGISKGSSESFAYEQELRFYARRLGLSDIIIFLPELSSQEFCVVYQIADVVLTPSTQEEGFCFANIEAMLSGTPVVTSKMGGPLDYIIHSQTGYFAPANDGDALFHILSDLYYHPPKRELLQNAREKARTFTIQRMAENYLRLFQEQ